MSKVSTLTQEFPRMPSGERKGPALFYTSCCSSCPDWMDLQIPRGGRPAGAQLPLPGGHSSESTVLEPASFSRIRNCCVQAASESHRLPDQASLRSIPQALSPNLGPHPRCLFSPSSLPIFRILHRCKWIRASSSTVCWGCHN